MIRKLPVCACLLLLSALNAPAPANDGHPLTMWHVSGANNSIFLLGSIHLLRPGDHPIPEAIYDAYAKADVLVMELDMDGADPARDQALVRELGLIRDGRSLADLLGDGPYAEAVSLASQLEIPLSLLDQSEPWYAAITVEIMMLMRAGFSPADGVEMRLTQLAVRDGKEIIGLETTREQLELLDNLSPQAQRELLLQTLSESMTVAELMDDMVAAWRRGDVAFLEQGLLADMQEQAELHDVIVADRNRNWVSQILDLADDETDYLVIVGALHLIGDEGVPNLLRESGLPVHQMSQPAATSN